ncbi:MAG: alpha-amylase family glycosyl hydrolase [Anaerorhabdus sp.]|uniref:alpha-amylase family glycosyl hydrolase n=2 Tax=Anaerorhabdus sp. TaxID=1872524 RepID=UPI002FCA5A62
MNIKGERTMAKDTRKEIANQSIYQVFVRNHSEEGTFKKVQDDLPRIKAMGFDTVYLMPINPIGVKCRKGTLGSPYAISDYRAINPEFGTLEDFKELIEETHKLDMKVMVDIVLNHTSPDNVYVDKHPEYYYRTEKGTLGNRVGDWTDIVDLDYSNQGLREELWDMLTYWAKLGIDGYRADVASIVPVDFWLEARRRVANINPNFIWLAESVHAHFINMIRNGGWGIANDYEIFEAFDICYDYDVFEITQEVFKRNYPLDAFKKTYVLQQSIYPKDALKLRHLENHDQPRIANLVQNKTEVENWIAYSFFAKGVAFVYAGQEFGATKHPSLFDKDVISLVDNGVNHSDLIKKLNEIKHEEIMINHDKYILHENKEDILMIEYYAGDKKMLGIFNVRGYKGKVKTDFEDGEYINKISGEKIRVENNEIEVTVKPIIIEK